MRFGLNAYDDPMESLTRLRQTHYVEVYKARFKILANRLRGLSDSYKLSCFLSGLMDDIRIIVRMFNPMDLSSTYSLDKLQEENINLTKKRA